jgi:hypothetical protein
MSSDLILGDLLLFQSASGTLDEDFIAAALLPQLECWNAGMLSEIIPERNSLTVESKTSIRISAYKPR